MKGITIVALLAVGAVFSFSIIAWVIYVFYHFISKMW